MGPWRGGIRFKQPIDMLALINRKLISQPSERRAMPASNFAAPLRQMGGQPGAGYSTKYLLARPAAGRKRCRRGAHSSAFSSRA
jgi:hypothetical protein